MGQIQKYQRTIFNLLRFRTNDILICSPYIIRKWDEIPESGYTEHRKKIFDKIGTESLERIRSFKETENDERIATQAIVHFNKDFYKSMNWREKVLFQILVRCDPITDAKQLKVKNL